MVRIKKDYRIDSPTRVTVHAESSGFAIEFAPLAVADNSFESSERSLTKIASAPAKEQTMHHVQKIRKTDGWRLATTAGTIGAVVVAGVSLWLAINARAELSVLRASVSKYDSKHSIILNGFDEIERRQQAMTDAAVKLMDRTAEIAMDANERARSVELKVNSLGR